MYSSFGITAYVALLLAARAHGFYDHDSHFYDLGHQPNCDAGPAFDATAYGINTSAYPFADDHACTTVQRNLKDGSSTSHEVCWREGNAEFDSGDVAWMLCATTFVMLQTPAAGFAQAGLVKRKNAMSVIGQAFMGVVIGCIMWYAIGYTLTFGPSCGYYGCRGDPDNEHQRGFIGDISAHYFFHGITAHSCSGSIPTLLFATFQMTFALMVPVLVTGAWAEKFKHTAAIMFMVIWPVLVYYPSAHWVWGGGFMAGWGEVGVLDYAGGVVIHTSSGVAAFVVALMVQRRRDFGKKEDTTHNLPLTMIGAALIWVGWYSFNGGSGLRANGQAIGALTVTQISSCFAGLTWGILSYLQDKKIQATHIASGALCGLAGITPASGFVLPYAGIPIGILTGMAGWYGGVFVKRHVVLDDVLDVTSLQAFPGAVGSILVGFFATTDALPCEAPVYPGKPCNRGNNEGMGIFHGGNGELLGYQIAAVVVMVLWSACMTWVTMIIIKNTVGINVSSADEEMGLDLAFHGEQAYDLINHSDVDEEKTIVMLINAAIAGNDDGVRKVIQQYSVHPRKTDVDGRTPLHLAAKHGRLNIVKMFIEEHHVSPNVMDLKNSTPLREARLGGHSDVVDYLTKKEGIVHHTHADGVRLLLAAAKGDVVCLTQQLSGGVDVNTVDYDDRSALHLAASENNEDSVKILLAAGAAINATDRWGRTALDDARNSKYASIVKLLEAYAHDSNSVDLEVIIPSQSQDRTANADNSTMEVLLAGRNGDVKELRRLKAKKENLFTEDYDGRTALHQAAHEGKLDAVKYLVSLKNCNVNHKDHDDHTPLADAVHGNHLQVVAFLKGMGGRVDVSHGQLCELAACGDVDALDRLFTAGVDVNTADYDGRTALHIGAAKGNADVVEMVLSHKANINVKDRHGGTPLDDAIAAQHKDLQTYLINEGAVVGETNSKHSSVVSVLNVTSL
eukprot:m.133538 g.133538  ORF g.133538 m.133538 type:complete len:960 (-) comp29681_c0_seq2:421-3300(-)